ncbi:MAG TPA: DUF559 domain-containing protein [Fimbriimonas sp.]
MKKHSRNTSSEARAFRHHLRAVRSTSEKIWEMIRKDRLGFHFRSGLSVGPYVLDFYCAEATLCIELDGEQHQGRENHDAARDAWLASKGIHVLRIPKLDLFEDTGLVSGRWVREVTRLCEERSGRSSWEPREGTRLRRNDDAF